MARLATEYVDLKDVRIAYREHGNGPILLLLHGNSESKRIFTRYQSKHFSDYRTIAVDSRGHGQSRSNDDEYSIDQFSDDVVNLCKAKNIHTAYIIGYSDGGNITLFLAKKNPDIFRKIVAISPNYLVSGTKDKALKLFRIAIKIVTLVKKLGFKVDRSIMRLNLMMKDIGITEEELKNITSDMKILYAAKDLIKEEHIRKIASLIPNASLTRIDGCNHMTILNKKETIETIRNYLRESIQLSS
jgi:pimeloyl-ACP methyl ester carboxylesterase